MTTGPHYPPPPPGPAGPSGPGRRGRVERADGVLSIVDETHADCYDRRIVAAPSYPPAQWTRGPRR